MPERLVDVEKQGSKVLHTLAAARRTRFDGLRDRTFDDTRHGANPELGGTVPSTRVRRKRLRPGPATGHRGNSAAVLSRKMTSSLMAQ